MIDAAGGPLVVSLRFLALAATTGLIGAWVFGHFVAARLTGATAERHRVAVAHLSARTALWCAVLLTLAALPRLLAQAAVTAPGEPPWAGALVLLRSRWGWLLAAQAATAAVGGIALLLRRRTRAWPLLTDACVAGLVVIPAFMGHAGTAETLRAASVLVDVVHVAAAGGWVGTLALLTVVVLRARHQADGPSLSAELITRFHPVAMVAAGTVFVTGLLTAWLRMGAPLGIASSSYSGLFVAKLLLVGVTGAIGAGHSKLARRRLQSVDVSAVGRSLLAESLLAVLVLVVTAVLAGTAAIG